MHCSICNADKEISTPGQYSNVLECGHITTSIPIQNIIKQGATATEAKTISDSLNRTQELPKVDTDELVTRVLSSMTQTYEDFFTTESPLMEDIISEHGKDKAVLIFTAIHSHMSRILFTMNRFRNLYYVKIEQMRKEIEDKAVKELIQNHDFYYTPQEGKKPTKPRSPKLSTEMDKAKAALGQLTDKEGKPVDVTKVLANLMWKKSPQELANESAKEDYKAGLDKIADAAKREDKAS